MKLRDAVKEDMAKAQASADDLRGLVTKMDPEVKKQAQEDVDTIRESINDIRSMVQKAGEQEVR